LSFWFVFYLFAIYHFAIYRFSFDSVFYNFAIYHFTIRFFTCCVAETAAAFTAAIGPAWYPKAGFIELIEPVELIELVEIVFCSNNNFCEFQAQLYIFFIVKVIFVFSPKIKKALNVLCYFFFKKTHLSRC
jgi:hypothetical protein